MTAMEAVFKRKSVRSYTGEKVSDDELALILKAANASPVGMGQFDSLHLTVIHNPEVLAEIEAAAAMMFGKPDMHPLYGAPTLILVSSRKPAPMMENVAFSNAAIMVHNMVLAAVELGVGACYIWGATAAMTRIPELLAKLNLPEGFIPCCAVSIGKTECNYDNREIPEDRISKTTIE